MASINATTSSGIVATADNTGTLQLQTAGTNAINIDASQRAAFVAGTAALPAITTSGDTNTGMFFPAADTIAFSEGGTESMRIDSSGNVGIGTTSPNNILQVLKSQIADTAIVVSNTGTANAATTMSFVLAESTTPQGWLRRYRDGTGHTEIGFSDNLIFAGNVTGTKAERMRINSSGKLVMASTTDGLIGSIQAGITANTASTNAVIVAAATSNGPYPIGARGESTSQGLVGFFNSSNDVIGSITKSGNNVAYNTSSDYRLKENIAPMIGALDKIALLKPVTYTWKLDGSDGQGFIAHELQEVVPECVNGQKDAVNEDGSIKPQGVDTSFLVATLTAAIQEQQTIINDLKARIEVLEAK